jgi:hypothetical protein
MSRVASKFSFALIFSLSTNQNFVSIFSNQSALKRQEIQTETLPKKGLLMKLWLFYCDCQLTGVYSSCWDSDLIAVEIHKLDSQFNPPYAAVLSPLHINFRNISLGVCDPLSGLCPLGRVAWLNLLLEMAAA